MNGGFIMSDKFCNCHEDNPGVGCDVTNCKYNTADCHCTAEKISVHSPNAVTKGETYCSTFCPRGSC